MDLTAVMTRLDKWVESHGSKRYVPPDYPSRGPDVFTAHEDFGMQQVRAEIMDFCELLLGEKNRRCVLELGLGYWGSSHYLWRMLYQTVGSVEVQWARLTNYQRAMREAGEPLDDRSLFFWGDSCSPKMVADVYTNFPEGIDLLFIDGNHDFGGILADYMLYHHLVRPGGIIAFHDAISKSFAVPTVLKIINQKCHDIVKSDDTGISWFRKESA